MRSYKYKLIRILFKDETLKLVITLDININPLDNKDVKVELKFTHEFKLKEFTNPLVFKFEMVSDSEKGSKINQLHAYFLINNNPPIMSDNSNDNEYILEESSDDDEYRSEIYNLNNSDWSEHKTIKGDSYLWNKVTGESVWKETIYDDDEWIEHVTEYGHNYWWNKMTDESIWENPYDLCSYGNNSAKVTEIKTEDKLMNKNKKSITHHDLITEKVVSHLRVMILYDKKNICFRRNIISVIVEMIKFIEQFLISGKDKKSLVIESLKICLESEHFSDNEYNLIVDVICPELIDILISVDKRETKIRNQTISCCFVNPWIK